MKMNHKSGKLLTIIICCYDGEKFLKGSLGSLLNQETKSSSYEILFINDCSRDSSYGIAKLYSNSLGNLRIMNNKKKLGVVKCCNLALKTISTPYFMRLDADDFLSLGGLKKALKDLRANKKNDFIVFQRWDVQGKKLKKAMVSSDIFSWIAVGSIFNTQAVRSVRGYSKQFWEEYDLYLKLLKNGSKYRISPFRIYYYRRGHNSMTKNSRQCREGFNSLIRKWGKSFLRRHGNLETALQYYGLK